MSQNAAHAVQQASSGGSKRRKREAPMSLEERLKANGISLDANGKLVIEEEEEKKRDKNDKGEKKKTVSLSALKKLRAAKNAKRLAKKGHNIKGGEEFKPGKRAQGDAKRLAKVEPYAYMSLNPKFVHEKHRSKTLASISEIVSKTKKSTLKKARQVSKMGRARKVQKKINKRVADKKKR